jgi:hypothetical protein
MLKLTRDELTFLRWLRTNGGKASLARSIGLEVTHRILSAAYITGEVDTVGSDSAHYTLTAAGYEALGLYGV